MDFTDNADQVTHAAVYKIQTDEIYRLDTAEGLGSGYFKEQMTITVDGEPLLVFVYLASPSHVTATLEPYHWYKELVLAGARKHQFPPEYLQQIAAVVSKPDLKDSRRIEMESLLVQLEG